MIKIENGCVDCELPCIGRNCSHRSVQVLSCDVCGEECDVLYRDNMTGEELCESCRNERYEIIERGEVDV